MWVNTLAEIRTRAIGVPLLFEPIRGSGIISSYLLGESPPAGKNASEGRSMMRNLGFGVADISISGPLVAREIAGPCAGFGPVSYEEIKECIEAIRYDPSISTVIFRINSPGGECSRLFDLVDDIYALRSQKTTVAVADDSAYSAAYAIFSACEYRYVTRTSGVGSIGVVSAHIDESEMDRQKGVKLTYIFAGEKKVNGNSHEPLSSEARSDFQAEINRIYGIFTRTVARNLSLPEEAIISTKAGCFFGENAVYAGLASAISSYEEIVSQILSDNSILPDTSTVDPEYAGIDEGVEGIKDDLNDSGMGSMYFDFKAECASHGLPDNLLESVRMGLEASQYEICDRIKVYSEIYHLCMASGKAEKADMYISSNHDMDYVRVDLGEELNRNEAKIFSRNSAPQDDSGQIQKLTLSISDIYAQRQRHIMGIQ